jgi:small subunit ribosomal protein S25e
LSQKQQTRQAEKTKAAEKRVLSLSVSNVAEVESFAKSQPYLTPYLIAERFGVRLSVAKKFLRELAEKGILRPLEGVTRLKLYVPTTEVKITPHKPQTAAQPVEGEEGVVDTGAKKKAKGKAAKPKKK